jgi:5-methyltetrahydrofolate--homocysteine methyltransferase
MGPLGKLLMPFGPISFEEAKRAFAEQARALAAGGVDLLVIETQFAVDEARAALEGARAETELPVVVSFSYDRGTRTMMGVKPEAAARTFRELGAAMIGVNCGTTLGNARAVVEEYAAATPGFPIWVKPNAGLPRMEGETAVYDVTPEGMGEFARSMVELGVTVVGGCCGTTPSHVRAISAAVHADNSGMGRTP